MNKKRELKKMNSIYMLAFIIFCITFLLDYICFKNNLFLRHWFNLCIVYYRYAFLSIFLIILPCYSIINDRKIGVMILGFPTIIFIAFILLLSSSFNRSLDTDSYYVELKGQKVIAMEEHFWGDETTIYYVPVNIFFMKRSTDFPYPYEP